MQPAKFANAQYTAWPRACLAHPYILDPTGKTVAGEVELVSRQDLESYIATRRKDM